MKIDIKKIAQLSNLTLSETEEKKLGGQLDEIVDYIEQLNELDTKDIEPTAQVTGLTNSLREDSDSRPSLSQEDAIKNSKTTHNGMFRVDQILEEK